MKPNIEKLKDDESIFSPNIIDYYQNRPGKLEQLTLAHFASDYEYFTKNNAKGEDDNLKEDDNIDDDDSIMDDRCIPLNNNMGYLKKGRRWQL